MASLRTEVESAFVTYLESLNLSATIYSGVSADTKDAPAVIVRLATAQEAPYKSGNYNCSVEVTVKSIASDEAAHEALCLAVGDAIWRDDIESQLQTANPGLRVFGASSQLQIAYDTDGDCWVETRTIEINCCAYQFTA